MTERQPAQPASLGQCRVLLGQHHRTFIMRHAAGLDGTVAPGHGFPPLRGGAPGAAGCRPAADPGPAPWARRSVLLSRRESLVLARCVTETGILAGDRSATGRRARGGGPAPGHGWEPRHRGPVPTGAGPGGFLGPFRMTEEFSCLSASGKVLLQESEASTQRSRAGRRMARGRTGQEGGDWGVRAGGRGLLPGAPTALRSPVSGRHPVPLPLRVSVDGDKTPGNRSSL